MGNARWDQTDWATHSAATSTQTRAQIFTQSGMHEDLDPAKFKKRESVASAANPRPTPIILASDVTGSMGAVAEQIIKTDLGTIMKLIYDRRPVDDPQVLCAAIGDAECDRAPIQATQFEASIVLADQLKNFFVEGGGGGNGGESYPLAWVLAAYKTKCDAIRKDGRKGYLFTIGDECPLPKIDRRRVAELFGLPAPEVDIRTDRLLAEVQKDWHVFHLIVNPVGSQPVVSAWRELLGERAVVLNRLSDLPEVIVSLIESTELSVAPVADNHVVIRRIGSQNELVSIS